MVRQYRAGAKPELTVLRDGTKLTLSVELVRAPRLDREMKKYRDENFEFTARDLTFRDRAEEGWAEDQPGAMVTEVKDGGWAAVGGLLGGDVVLSVNGNAVADVAALEMELKKQAQAHPTTVVLLVRRGIHTRFVELEPDWNGRSQSSLGAKE